MQLNAKNKAIRILAAAMVVILGMGSTEVAFAGNTGDTSWSFTLDANGSRKFMDESREKLDTTKIYFKWSTTYSGGVSELLVAPYGAHSATGTRSPAGASGTIKEYRITAKGQYSITNYVKELGYSHANVGVRTDGDLSGGVAGVWSPDSTKNYTVPQ